MFFITHLFEDIALALLTLQKVDPYSMYIFFKSCNIVIVSYDKIVHILNFF